LPSQSPLLKVYDMQVKTHREINVNRKLTNSLLFESQGAGRWPSPIMQATAPDGAVDKRTGKDEREGPALMHRAKYKGVTVGAGPRLTARPTATGSGWV
jgi:hypothetical protein